MLQQHSLVIHSCSTSGYDDSEKPEIALILNVDFEEVLILKHEVESALADEGLPSVGVTLEKDIRWFTFGDTHLKAFKNSIIEDISHARESIDDLVRIPIHEPSHRTPTNLAKELLAILSQSEAQKLLDAQSTSNQHGGSGAVGHRTGVGTTDFMETFMKASSRGTSSSDVPSDNLTEVMLITEAKYKSMRDARDDNVEGEVNGLKNVLNQIVSETKSTAQVANMIAGGLIAVGSAMVTAYGYITTAGSLTAAISGIIASIGGAGALAAIASVVVAVFVALVAFAKDAVNELMVINGLVDKKVNFTKDWIIDGERDKITLEIPASEQITSKPYAYGCGSYAYWKTRWWGTPVGFFGSNAGIAFKASDGTEFSVGVDCPNTAAGGTNCIRTKSGSRGGSCPVRWIYRILYGIYHG